MFGRLRRAVRFLDHKIGWRRIGLVLSVSIIAAAAVVLYRMLHNIDVDYLVEAIKSYELHQIVLSGLFVFAGYFTLTFYDLFALRTIGRKEIPYRVAALSAFTSYAIGHNLGASIFTGGAVRYRIYSDYGLSAIEVAKICFLAGLTFWLGNATVLGLGVTYTPQAAAAIDQLPLWLNRAVALVVLGILTTYVAWVWRTPRVIGRCDWEVALPRGPLTLLQIVIGIIDLGFCALAMFTLLPDDPHIGFVTVAVVFVAATLLGFASHSPGGLGVFDAAMLVALWQFEKEDVLAGLLLFRLLYYMAPFALSLVVLGGREIWLNLRASEAARAGLAPASAPPASAAPADAAPDKPAGGADCDAA